jgi:uncharacterized protein
MPTEREIETKVKLVEDVFRDIDRDTGEFCAQTGLHCKDKCGHCCLKPDIEAAVLEFIPLAYLLYREGTAETWLERLKEEQNKDNPLCILFSNRLIEDKGFCTMYEYRPIICRLFGFAAMTDKTYRPKLVTCEIIKKEFPGTYGDAVSGIEKGFPVPLMKNYYFRLMSIDLFSTQKRYPLNTAIRLAIEDVLFHLLF